MQLIKIDVQHSTLGEPGHSPMSTTQTLFLGSFSKVQHQQIIIDIEHSALKELGHSPKHNSNRLLLMSNILHSENWIILQSITLTDYYQRLTFYTQRTGSFTKVQLQ